MDEKWTYAGKGTSVWSLIPRSLRENSILSQETALRVRKMLCFVSGHDFSRAVNVENMLGFRACVRTRFCLGKQLYGCGKCSVLYQGTTLVGP